MRVSADLDPRAVRLQFDRRATRRANADFSLARADFILREVERRLFDRLDPIRVDPQRVLDLGCGLGSGAMRLAQRFERARVIGVDGSAAMAAHAARLHAPGAARRLGSWLARRVPGVRAGALDWPDFVASDAHRLALGDDTIDLVWSNLAWHWFADPLAVIAQCHRVLRGGGLLILSSFGVDTLRELRALGADLAQFPDLHDIGDALVAAGFADPVLDAERITVNWESPPR
ncbi:MAG: methyltransferase domain-containing protein, partial [Burkholderiaceae bacterium]|nr:methyltransferase domain-containing protein [Burkholderiaceae bacterium]